MALRHYADRRTQLRTSPMPQSDQFVPLFALSAVLLSGPSCMNPAEAVTAQQTPTIGASFDAFWMAARDRPFEEQQAIWDQVIEQPRQDVYASVVWEERDHARWKEAKEQLLRRRFAQYASVGDQISPAARNLQSNIPI